MGSPKHIRRDSRGRELYTNECQIANGSYTFRYRDLEGKNRTVTRWRLLPGDACPVDRDETECLREAEERIRRSLMRDVSPPRNGNMTVNDFWEKYLSLKVDIKESSLVSLIYLYNRHIKDRFGKRKIGTIRYSDVKRLYIERAEQGLSLSSLEQIARILNALFDMAVRDGYIPVNPAEGVMAEFRRRKDWDRKEIEALTEKEQKALMAFLGRSYEFREYRPIIIVLLGTGMRAGEALGLRWDDVDFGKNEISVNHTLHYGMTLEGKTSFYISFPKTKAGTRIIPMLPDVRETLSELYERRGDFNSQYQVVVDGYTDFIFRDLNGMVFSDHRMNDALKRIQKRYQEEELIRATEENRLPVLIKPFRLHSLRHTYCTRLCMAGLNLPVIQRLMGHSYFETTLRVYNHITSMEIHREVAKYADKVLVK